MDVSCWSCGTDDPGPVFCRHCRKIQPVGARNYFEALSLPPMMALDRAEVDRSFREASRDVHPDRLGRSASALERRLAVEQTAYLNDAYRALKDQQTRAEYLMSLQGVVIDEMTRTKDPAFLMEMLEQQEAVDEATSVESLEARRGPIETRKRNLMDGLRSYFDDGEGEQEAAARALDELRYLRRLLDRIDAKLEEIL